MHKTIPLYCNPFFPRCKHFFRKNPNFFSGSQGKPPNPAQNLPKTRKYGSEPPSRPQLPENSPGGQPKKVSHPDVPLADAEEQHQPDPAGHPQEQGIAQLPAAPSRGPEEVIEKPQGRPQGQGGQQPFPGQGRAHPNRRRFQAPDCRGSS